MIFLTIYIVLYDGSRTEKYAHLINHSLERREERWVQVPQHVHDLTAAPHLGGGSNGSRVALASSSRTRTAPQTCYSYNRFQQVFIFTNLHTINYSNVHWKGGECRNYNHICSMYLCSICSCIFIVLVFVNKSRVAVIAGRIKIPGSVMVLLAVDDVVTEVAVLELAVVVAAPACAGGAPDVGACGKRNHI